MTANATHRSTPAMSRLRLRVPAFHAHLTSFLWMFDLKVGATVITLFALFNKIAGLYGIIAIFQGGTLLQISLYLYSLLTLFVFLWAIRGISDEDPHRVLRYSHLFLGDHLISTTWTLFFGIDWFVYNRHDGEKPPLNEYQEGLMGLIESIESQYETTKVIHHTPLVGQARVEAAQRVWRAERGFSEMVLIFGWLIKIYFALVLYSYALHLRHGTYRSLPLSKSSGHNQSNGHYQAIPEHHYELEGDEEDDVQSEGSHSRASSSAHHQHARRGSVHGDASSTNAPSRSGTPVNPAFSQTGGIQRPQSRLGRRQSASISA